MCVGVGPTREREKKEMLEYGSTGSSPETVEVPLKDKSPERGI